MSVASLVPDPSVLFSLKAAEVGAILLEYLHNLPPNERLKFLRTNIIREEALLEYPRNERSLAARIFSEGWVWLQREEMIAPEPGDNYSMSFFITRRGENLRTREHVAAFMPNV